MTTPVYQARTRSLAVLIAGGSGFIGRYLSTFLIQRGHHVTVLTRSADRVRAPIHCLEWDGRHLKTDLNFDVIINLCGLNIAEKRWTPAVKHALLDSRLLPTQGLVNFIKQNNKQNNADRTLRFLNASAVGFYPSHPSPQTELKYATAPHPLFSQTLVSRWEACAQQAASTHTTVSCLRFGVVLGRNGGLLQKLCPLYRLGLGSIMGNKAAYLSWVHLHDLCRAILFILGLSEPKTVYNITAPNPCTQDMFSKTLAHALHRRCLFRFPSGVIKLLFGQMGEELLLADQRILPYRLNEAGFQFDYPTIETALTHLCAPA